MYETSEEIMSLVNLGNGAAVEMFDMEVQKVLTNLDDPNTDPKKERTVTLKVTFKPTETQGMIATKITVDKNLAGQKAFPGLLMVGRNNGRMEARELHQEQRQFDFKDKVVSIDKTE